MQFATTKIEEHSPSRQQQHSVNSQEGKWHKQPTAAGEKTRCAQNTKDVITKK
jgi:hypothetical protein